MPKDLLDETVEKRSWANPGFPQMVEAATRARRLLQDLAERRKALGLSQTVVAARMGTSQSALARIEAGESDPRITTVERYALAVGRELAHRKASAATRRSV